MNAEEFEKYMSKEKRDRSYLMAFASCDWKPKMLNPIISFTGSEEYPPSVHVSDDLLSEATWEMIDICFSEYTDIMFVWRNDGKALTDTEAEFIHEYVVDDMEDYTSEGEGDSNKSIHKYLTESEKCLILLYDKPALEMFDSEEFWSDVEEQSYDHAIKGAEKIAEGKTDHDKLSDILTGKKQKGQQFDVFSKFSGKPRHT